MKTISKHSMLKSAIFVLLLGGLTAEAQAKTVFSDDFESDPVGPYGHAYVVYDARDASAGIVAGKSLRWTGTADGDYGVIGVAFTPARQPGAKGPNTSTKLSDYTLSFDFAVDAGFRASLEVTILATDGGDSAINLPIDIRSINGLRVGHGFVPVSINLGDSSAKAWLDHPMLNPAAHSFSIEFRWIGGGSSDVQTFRVDNVKLSVGR